MINNSTKIALCLCLLLILSPLATAQRQMENLTRGIVAVKQADGVYVSWRLFGTDPETVSFNLYRITGSGEPVKVNENPITESTNYVDSSADPNQELQADLSRTISPVSRRLSGYGSATGQSGRRPGNSQRRHTIGDARVGDDLRGKRLIRARAPGLQQVQPRQVRHPQGQ